MHRITGAYILYYVMFISSYGTHDTYKLTSVTSIFIFTLVMKVQVKVSVFASKF